MAIRVSLFTVESDPSMLDDYLEYIHFATMKKRSEQEGEIMQSLQKDLEAFVGKKFGFKTGKGGSLEPDYFVADESLVPGFFLKEGADNLTVEGKIQAKDPASRTRTTIGSKSLNAAIKDKMLSTRQLTNALSAADSIADVKDINSETFLQDAIRDSNMTVNDFVFDELFKRSPELKRKFFEKSRRLAIASRIPGSSKINVLTMVISRNDFNKRLFEATVGKNNTIHMNIRTSGERAIKKSIEEALQSAVFDEINEFTNGIKQFKHKAKRKSITRKVQGNIGNLTTIVEIAAGGSIPMSIGKIATPRSDRKGSKFRKGMFLSNEVLTHLLKKRMRQVMPTGPRKGPPKSDTMLTNRTFTFLNSIEVMADYRYNLLNYTYDQHPYAVHVPTNRNPEKLISGTLREIAHARFGRNFNIIRQF